MNWRDFLTLATRLTAAATEADWRTALSRAYYAAFHVARSLFSDLNFTVPRADRAHQYPAAGIIQALDAGQIEPGRTRMRDAMIVYERDVLHDVTWRP